MWKLLSIITDHSAVSGERDQKEDQQQFDDHRQPHLRSWFCKARHDEYVRRVIDILRRLLSKYARTGAPVRHSHPRSRESRPVHLAFAASSLLRHRSTRMKDSRASMHVNIISTRHPDFFDQRRVDEIFNEDSKHHRFLSAISFVPLSRSFLEWNDCQL